jgi:hypothetical protein
MPLRGRLILLIKRLILLIRQAIVGGAEEHSFIRRGDR